MTGVNNGSDDDPANIHYAIASRADDPANIDDGNGDSGDNNTDDDNYE